MIIIIVSGRHEFRTSKTSKYLSRHSGRSYHAIKNHIRVPTKMNTKTKVAVQATFTCNSEEP
ncbi:hypothetical protein BRADI_1g33745v3 [Brachypodium distachyon]|uniref:Uncharacterized protein n=1 Tax=Brachypodium distachyon TaxID=15368 RepID=A0A2K2DMJ2_BRADI|nr:hypothetical protein BRADI_1g33745v3 [Brachypodium distachyon]